MSLSGAEEVTIRGQEEATQDEAPHGRRATREVDSECVGGGALCLLHIPGQI